MRLLLDTHVLIWWDEGQPLDAKADRAIREAEQVYVSAASGWEVAIKTSLGRLHPRRTVSQAVIDSGFEELPVLLSHTERVSTLPWRHRDPFDRLLVSQALTEQLTIITRDRILRKYEVRVILA
ncbi:MAG TPA: type II toxin-antitoxin system VapC family toxin [Gemmatimonadales bacterium]